MRPSHPFEGYPSEGRAQGGEVTRRFWLATVLSGMLVLAACGGSPAKTSQGKPAQAPGNPCVPGSCGAGINSGINSAPTTTTSSGARPPSTRALQVWGAAHLATLQTLSNEASHLLAGAGDADQVKLACAQLGSQAQAALASPPPPDAAAAAHLQSGLTQLVQLSRDCATAFNAGNTTAASRLVYEANQATAAINQVIQTVNAAGQTVS